ncbi:hypothetical protein ACET3Z_020606 [Daucus carota]
MGKVKTELSPPDEENEEDFTNHLPGIMTTIDLGLCDDEYVKFSLTSAEPYWKMQKGLIIYGYMCCCFLSMETMVDADHVKLIACAIPPLIKAGKEASRSNHNGVIITPIKG